MHETRSMGTGGFTFPDCCTQSHTIVSDLEEGWTCPCKSSDALKGLLSIEGLQAPTRASQPAGCLQLSLEHHMLQDTVWKVEQGCCGTVLVHLKSLVPADAPFTYDATVCTFLAEFWLKPSVSLCSHATIHQHTSTHT